MSLDPSPGASLRRRPGTDPEDEQTREDSRLAAPETVVELLEDDHARAVLSAVTTTAKPARQLVEELESSRATVYRRLDSLEEAGLLTTRMEYDPDGHHRQVYRATLDSVTLSMGEDGLAVESADLTGPT